MLSWDLAREFVTYDMGRTRRLTGTPSLVPVIARGAFREVRVPVFVALQQMGAGALLDALHLAVSADGKVWIPTSGEARVISSAIRFRPRDSHETTTTRVNYSIVVPKPFCAKGPYDLVRLEGPLDFSMTVETNRWGRYERNYLVGGTLRVTPMQPISATEFVPTGEPPVGDPRQSLSWRFAAGGFDRFARQLLCGDE